MVMVGSNTTRGMNICPRFSVFVFSVDSSLAMSRSTIQGILLNIYKYDLETFKTEILGSHLSLTPYKKKSVFRWKLTSLPLLLQGVSQTKLCILKY
jgi:hypothetical protein